MREDAERLRIPLEAARLGEHLVQRFLARVAERRVPDVVRQPAGLHEVGIDEKIGAQRLAADHEVIANAAPDLRHFERMGEARAVKIVFAGVKHLRLGLQAAEGRGVDDPVAIDLEGSAPVGFPLAAEVERGGVVFVIEGIWHNAESY